MRGEEGGGGRSQAQGERRRCCAKPRVGGWVGGCDEWRMAGCPPTSKIRQGGEKNRRKVSHLAASCSVTAEVGGVNPTFTAALAAGGESSE